MCGIVGKVCFNGAPIDPAWLRQACELLAHRGPDGQGEVIEGGSAQPSLAFGHRRLKVIDLSGVADQPMRNTGCVDAARAHPLVIVFNGEIYNYKELRRRLETGGHRFTSQSDTEIILHLFEDHGLRFVDQLRGMFAIALWDSKTRRIILARDRVGKKPLYYRYDKNTLWFGSEPRAILADPEVPLVTSARAIREYLAFGYVPSPGSAFDGLHRIPPGHIATVNSDGVHLEAYWKLRYYPKSSTNHAEAIERFTARFDESVRMRLISDVPLGAFLSGGIDSSAVVAASSRHAAGRLKTFSIGFDDPQFNELHYARLVAHRYETEHHEFIVKPELETLLPKLAWHYGEPFADSSAVPTYHLARLARQHITVALNGDGGDESFAGYRRYVAHRTVEGLSRIPGASLLAAGIASWLPKPSVSRSRLYDLQRFLSGFRQDPARRYLSWFGFFDDEDGFLDPPFAEKTRESPTDRLASVFQANSNLHSVDAAMASDIELYLPDDLLVKVDIASMAEGLEARSPFLDHVLMEEAARLPVPLKLPGRSTKYFLKKALKGRVPDEVLFRPKMGFGIPLDRWLREDLRQMMHDVLLSARAQQRGYFRPGAVKRLLLEHNEGRVSHAHRIWALLMLELWELSSAEAARTTRVPVSSAFVS